MNNPNFYEWLPPAWLRVTGEDAAGFLQGQFTNELRQLGDSGQEAVYGLWLNQKGRVLADSFILRTAEAFWIGSYGSTAAVIRERLEAYIIADDVEVEDVTGVWAAVTIFTAERPQVPFGLCFPGRRGADAHFEWIFPREKLPDVQALLGEGSVLDANDLSRRRIEAGLPWVPLDIGPGDLPGEGGLEAAAISYTKGCYLGQEVMARLKSMGQVRRRLARVRGPVQPATLPAELYQSGKKIGELRTVAKTPDGFIGLAMLTLLHWKKEEGLAFSAEGLPAVKGESL